MMAASAGRGSSCCDAARSEAMGRYLRAIYLLGFKAPPVLTSDVAARLGVAPPSVSAMLHRLDAAGLLAGSGSGGISLTEHGQRHARDVVRRHRLIETFLVRAAGMSWDEVHDEAEALQHAVSDLLVERIDAALGHPRSDPHGDPIPPPEGDHVEDWSPALASAPVGAWFRVDRVSDEDSAALQYLAGLGVRPGVMLRVLEREPFGGPLWVEAEGQRRAMGVPLTHLVHGVVQP
ncbi:MAG TPA: metal-dependent transcriptional regulator [Streptosporangiaceae bacterium]|nr:metal-dependent transcriptional regulator [Streptosporangiaceae bacterium]